MREAFGRVRTVAAFGESLPNPGSVTDLDPDRKDMSGLPLAHNNSRLEEGELRRLRLMVETALAAIGFGDNQA